MLTICHPRTFQFVITATCAELAEARRGSPSKKQENKMNTTYTQKSETVQRVANNSAANVMDTSLQSASLQRKADLADGALQRASLEEEEEPVQGKSIQREAIPEEEEELA